ncbi:hypothetical protein [Streptomyces sp. AN091965]|uniref:hypothetical protein n=1 Tax=Streptomyces sp. AN091965 TaxID=2927803 RepID=UPI001F621EFA|nr:hypothetical protein [Streptomyces sp. AN091965]MCI3932144.1 hypothetical protein [Streptomyces sp. AN091965]
MEQGTAQDAGLGITRSELGVLLDHLREIRKSISGMERRIDALESAARIPAVSKAGQPGTVVASGPVGRLVDNVDVLGDPEPGAPTRVTVDVCSHLSFGELLALLLFTPGLNLLWSELEDDDVAVREGVSFAVLANDLLALDDRADYAVSLYRRRPQACAPAGLPEVDPTYVYCVGQAIQRVYGVTA